MRNGNSIESVYRAIAEYYEQIFPTKSDKLHFLLPLIDKNSDILDIGCNTGNLLMHLSPYCNSATGIDPSEASIEIAKENLSDLEGSNLHFISSGMEDVPYTFPPSSFSHVFCLGNTLAHIGRMEDLGTVLQGFFKVMKPGGIITIQLVNYNRVLGFQDFSFMPLKKEKLIFQRRYTLLEDKDKIGFHTKIRDFETGFTSDNDCQLTTIKISDLRHQLGIAGFRCCRFFGSFQRSSWTVESGPLILKARKPLHLATPRKRIYC